MGPREFFGEHPQLYWLALSGPILTAGCSLVAMCRAGDERQSRRYAALAALSALQAIGLARIRPSGDARPRTGSRWLAPCCRRTAQHARRPRADPGPRGAIDALTRWSVSCSRSWSHTTRTRGRRRPASS
jgi:hypothetical protein